MSEDKEDRNYHSSNRQPTVVFVYVFVILLLALLLLIAVWPNIDRRDNILRTMTGELRLILLVVLGGLFGSALRSYSALMRIVQDKSKDDFTAIHMWRVFSGVPPALIIYFIIRGVIISPNAPLFSINAIGVLFISVLLGFFSVEFLDKLYSVFRPYLAKETILEGKIQDISSALGIDILDNYSGYFCYYIYHMDRRNELDTGQGLSLLPGKKYKLTVYFEDIMPRYGDYERIEISGGNDVKKVKFNVVPRFDTISLKPREQSVLVGTDKRSEKIWFDFAIPIDQRPSDFWIEIHQKNRLIVSVSPKINVG